MFGTILDLKNLTKGLHSSRALFDIQLRGLQLKEETRPGDFLAHPGPPLLTGCVTELVRAPNGTVGQLRNGWDEKLLVDLPGGGKSGWWVSMIFYVHPEPWENDPIGRAYFSNGLVQPPTRNP